LPVLLLLLLLLLEVAWDQLGQLGRRGQQELMEHPESVEWAEWVDKVDKGSKVHLVHLDLLLPRPVILDPQVLLALLPPLPYTTIKLWLLLRPRINSRSNRTKNS